MDKNNREWKNLSLKEKAQLMSIYVQNGYTDVGEIRKDYNKNYAHYMEANPDFMQRLRDNDTTSVANSDGSRSTHKLSYVEGDNGATLFPSVQREKDGTLKDHSDEELGGYWSAEEKGDTINVSTPSAIWLSENYKKDFPKYFEKFINKFEEGGFVPSGGTLQPQTQTNAPYEWTDSDIANYIKMYEQYRDEAYLDAKGHPTAGWGHKLSEDEIEQYWDAKTNKPKGKIPEEVSNRWWQENFNHAYDKFHEIYGDEDLPSNAVAAIVSMIYHGGPGLVKGYKDKDGNIKGFPKLEAAIRAYSKNKTQKNLNAVIDQMQYKDDGKEGLSGLSNRYGLTRAIMEGIVDPKKMQEYKDNATYLLYRSNKAQK